MLFTMYNWGDKVKNDGMDGACGMHGKRCINAGFWWENMKETACTIYTLIDR
jgi:hypothetical protein